MLTAVVELTAEEQRVLGCLIEKEATTPDQYPLTMNSLLLACNQTTNRDPVVLYDQDTVGKALASLREKQLTRVVYPAHARATKYRQVLAEAWALTEPELAVLAVLLLRGPQTLTELRSRTDRYTSFEDLGGVDGVLDRLASRPEPMVVRLGRQPGQREERFAHLLAGPVDEATSARPEPAFERERGEPREADSRLEALEAEVGALRSEVEALRDAVDHLLGR
jgi:uncharacterized protein YceH (UPF0502 family)